MPNVFVPGPSINPRFTSPGEFIKGISNTFQGFQDRRVKKKEAEALKIFQDETLAQADRKQDFAEGATERTELKRVQDLARDNDKFNTAQNIIQGLQFGGADRIGELESRLVAEVPGYAQLSETDKLAERNKFILNSPTALTKPKKFASELRTSLGATNKYTGAEIDKIVSDTISSRYPTRDKDIVKSQLLKPKDLLGTSGTNINIGGGSGKLFSGKGGNFNFVSDPVNQGSKTEQLNQEFELIGLTDKGTSSTLGVRHELAAVNPINPFGNFDFNVTQQGYSKAISKLEGSGLSVSEAIAVLRDEIDGDLESSLNFEDLSTNDVDKLVVKAQGIKAQQTQLFNKKGGGISGAGQTAGVFTPTDAANAAAVYNEKLLSGLVPRALSDDEVVKHFLNNLGGTAAPGETENLQGGGGGDGAIIPEAEAAPPAELAGTADVIPTIASQASPAAEFPIGGELPAQAMLNRVFKQLSDPKNIASTNPIFGPALEAAETVSPLVQKLFKSLTPNTGQGILNPGPSTPDLTPRQARQTQVDNLTSSEKSQALTAARKLSKEGKIKLADGEGGSADESLLIAYFKYLEGQRN